MCSEFNWPKVRISEHVNGPSGSTECWGISWPTGQLLLAKKDSSPWSQFTFIHLSVALQPLLNPVRFFSFLIYTQSVGLLGRGSAQRKAATYTNTEYTQTDIHAWTGIRTHDLSVRAGKDISCLRQRGHCDRWPFT
jgi:hypothetical protein